MGTVVGFSKPEDAWNFLERYFDEVGVDERLRPEIRKALEPAVTVIARRPTDRKFTMSLPPNLSDDQLRAIESEAQRILSEIEQEHQRVQGRLLAMIAESLVDSARSGS